MVDGFLSRRFWPVGKKMARTWTAQNRAFSVLCSTVSRTLQTKLWILILVTWLLTICSGSTSKLVGVLVALVHWKQKEGHEEELAPQGCKGGLKNYLSHISFKGKGRIRDLGAGCGHGGKERHRWKRHKVINDVDMVDVQVEVRQSQLKLQSQLNSYDLCHSECSIFTWCELVTRPWTSYLAMCKYKKSASMTLLRCTSL